MALSELVAQGHDFHELVDVYPASLVKGLLAATRQRRRLYMAEQAMTFAMGVCGGLDLAFNKGRGKILDAWIKDILKEDLPGTKKKGPQMSDRAFAFFMSLPRKRVGQ